MVLVVIYPTVRLKYLFSAEFERPYIESYLILVNVSLFIQFLLNGFNTRNIVLSTTLIMYCVGLELIQTQVLDRV